MNILIINCHPENIGDESAISALVEEINSSFNYPNITLMVKGEFEVPYRTLADNVKIIPQPSIYNPNTMKQIIDYAKNLKNKTSLKKEYLDIFCKAFIDADFVIHAPGGPCMGSYIYEYEMPYLMMLTLAIDLNKPFLFYAPSMGPFAKDDRSHIRDKILNNAKAIIVRDNQSYKYLKEYMPNKNIYQTMDACLQQKIDTKDQSIKLKNYDQLNNFLSNSKCVGITLTDLAWHHKYSKNTYKNIDLVFRQVINKLTNENYKVILIPNLYGKISDYKLMQSYVINNKCFCIDNKNINYDNHFIQFVISQLYALIGLRHHSNIFSAKMKTPFISISYEYKMTAFMSEARLQQYNIDVQNLSFEQLWEKFCLLNNNYSEYKTHLIKISEDLYKKSYQSTEIMKTLINN